MGRYDNLSDMEKKVLRRMVDARSVEGDGSWILVVSFDGSELLATVGESLANVPRSEPFYIGLAEKGFVSLGRTSQGSLNIGLQQSAVEYADYAAKSRMARWWEDLTYELAEERTVRARLFWVVLGYGFGFLSAILLRLLGWTKIGS
ncbi:MAG: hypothetical protein ACOC6F_02345 [bacterium]